MDGYKEEWHNEWEHGIIDNWKVTNTHAKEYIAWEDSQSGTMNGNMGSLTIGRSRTHMPRSILLG